MWLCLSCSLYFRVTVTIDDKLNEIRADIDELRTEIDRLRKGRVRFG